MPRTSRLPAQREIAAEPEDLVLRLLGSLRAIADPRGVGRSKAVTRPGGAAQPTRPLDRCEPPRSDAPPQFSVDYTRLILAPTIRPPTGPEQPVIEPGGGFMPVVDLACAGTKLDVNMALALTFRQTWNLLGTFIGDLSSTMGLAPSEQLTLEFVSSQRRLLEKLTVDSREEITTRENTTLDKEVMNVAHGSSRTEKWGVNGKGSFSLGFITLGAGADVSGTTMTTAQDSTQNIAEATEKSARTLKTLQKVEVRGVNETFVSNRVVRTIKNPYPDRTMAMNVYQLVKRFAVETCLAELRPALVITLNELEFNAGFIARHRAFLREALLDPSLLEEVDRLAIAVEGSMDAKGDSVQATATAARESAKLALRYLFEEPNIFSLPVNPRIRSRRGQPINPNRPATSFSASLPSEIDYSGFGDSQARDLIDIFVTTAWFYDLYRTLQAADQIDEEAVGLVTSLAAAVESRVQTLITGADSNVLAVMDNQALTEVFRRLPGFLATVKGMVQPRIDAAEAARATRDLQSEAIRATRALVDHLACHQAHYTQRFLAYLAERSANAMIVDFVKRVIESRGPLYAGVFDVVDVERSYLDRTAIIVPGFRGVSETPMERLVAVMDGGRRTTVQECVPVVSEVEVPCDGVHLEVAPGTCVLPDVPALVEAVAAD